ncbi:MAG: lipase family protein [Leptolyngbyaceae cyanobacterium]
MGLTYMLDEKLAWVCARLSLEVYKDFASLKEFDSMPGVDVTLFESNDGGVTDTQVAILHKIDAEELYIVFRGSNRDIDWMNNLQFRQQIYRYGDESTTDVRFHRGFMTAYFSIRDRLLAEVRKYPNCAITVTGHSLGGAVAKIAALDLQYNITQHTGQFIQVFTFGAPRVGNRALVESFTRRVPNCYRFIFGWDIVTRIPRRWQGYKHVPREYRLGNRWSWKIISRRFKDHYIINYVNALAEKLEQLPT